jgi:DNA-binding NarL/FixJ family response regulator
MRQPGSNCVSDHELRGPAKGELCTAFTVFPFQTVTVKLQLVSSDIDKPGVRSWRVLIVDSFPLLRDGLAAAIEASGCFTVCGQAGGVAAAKQDVEHLHPDLVTTCLQLGCGDGLELIKQLRASFPQLRILVLSALDEEVWAERALRAGADGFIMKTAEAQEVLSAMKAISRGETWLSAKVTARVLRKTFRKEALPPKETAEALSDRELHVFRLIGSGHGTRQIARELGLSPKTIETYREHIKVKLRLSGGAELIERAQKFVEENGRRGEAPEEIGGD